MLAPVELTVTTASDEVGGAGLSLREAIQRTNAEPGTYTIRFAPALRGGSIVLAQELPPLAGGGVTIEGAGITLRPGAPAAQSALRIWSSGNRVEALALEGFDYGVVIEQPHDSLPTDRTFSDTVLSGLVMRGIRFQGILLDTTAFGNCRVPCVAPNRWLGTTIAGNEIEAGFAGIMFFVAATGSRVEQIAVTGNSIRVTGPGAGPGIGITTAGDSSGARIADVLVARNTIEGSPDIGIMVASGAVRAQHGTVERVRVIDNRLDLVRRGPYFCCQGITVQAGSDAPGLATGPPVRYLDDNVARDVLVRGNTIRGTLQWGVQVIAGFGGGGRSNVVEEVRVQGNAIDSTSVGTGVYVVLAAGTPYRNRIATGNRITDVWIDANRIAIGRRVAGGVPAYPGGIALQGGGSLGRGNSLRHVRVRRNRIETSRVGVTVVGGSGASSRRNTVRCVRLAGNRIMGTRRAVAVIANHRGARGNRATLRC